MDTMSMPDIITCPAERFDIGDVPVTKRFQAEGFLFYRFSQMGMQAYAVLSRQSGRFPHQVRR